MDINKSFGKHLKALRNQKKWTQEKLEDVTNVAYRSIQDLESGRTLPSLITVFKLSKGFGISPLELIEPVWKEWLKTQK